MRLKETARFLLDTKGFYPQNARLLLSFASSRDTNRDHGYSDDDHLAQAVQWLARAQDSMSDGGVAGRWRIGRGWTSSYPETTGYIVPTLLELARLPEYPEFTARARRAVEFLLRVQLPCGAFSAGEIADNTSLPSVFNSAQVVCGLCAWHAATGDLRALEAACRAADWIVGLQEADGAWRTHVYCNVPSTAMAHAACWIAQLGATHGIRRYRDSAQRHHRWVLRHVDPTTGWIDLAGHYAQHQGAREAYTHFIAYTLWGSLLISEALGDAAGIAAVERASRAIARRCELDGRLPGVLDHHWHGSAPYTCVTGTAQMALVWFRLYRIGRDTSFVNAALAAIEAIKRSQRMRAAPVGALGGLPGSDPPWGEYIRGAFPSWAVKFFVDALLEKRRVVSLMQAAAPARGAVTHPEPTVMDIDLAAARGMHRAS
jgi:hypothetical protein